MTKTTKRSIGSNGSKDPDNSTTKTTQDIKSAGGRKTRKPSTTETTKGDQAQGIQIEIVPIERGATPDPNNVNKHTERGSALLENSIRRRGAFRSIASAGKNVETPVVGAGNFTFEKAIDAGFTEIINVHTKGNQLVNVVRDDLDPTSPEFFALALEDNEIGKQSYNPDVDLAATLAADPAIALLRSEDHLLNQVLEDMGSKSVLRINAGDESDEFAEGDQWREGSYMLMVNLECDPEKREFLLNYVKENNLAFKVNRK
jgi:hypothetical protein